MSMLLSKPFGKKNDERHPVKSRRRPRSARLALEALELRAVPIVGAYGLPAALSPNPAQNFGHFDMTGVVSLDIQDANDSTATTVVTNGTGTLLSSGRHILTAAHLLTDEYGRIDVPRIHVVFELPGGNRIMDVVGLDSQGNPTGNYQFVRDANGNSLWDGIVDSGNDLAILTLPALAPVNAVRHSIFRGSDEVGRWFYVAGYGNTGIADQDGQDCDNRGSGVKRMGTNFFDGTESSGNLLDFDFSADTDDWAGAANLNDWTSNGNEVDTAPGDSGGPSFLWGPTGLEIAAVTSDGVDGSCFGAYSQNTRVSTHQSFIDGVTSAAYDLVIDMSAQSAGNNGGFDTIEVRNTNGPNFLVEVRINGHVVYADDFNKIKSVTVTGSNDDEQITFDLNGLYIPFRVDGSGGRNNLIVKGTSAAETVTLAAATVSNAGAVFLAIPQITSTSVNFYYLTGIEVDTRGGDDSITIASMPSGMAITLDGGTDTNTLVGMNVNSRWNINSANGGTLNSAVTFSNIANLTGGTRKDEFLYGLDGSISGVIDGGLGNNTIRGPSLANIWAITQNNGGALNSVGAFRQIENLTGGGGDDRFVFYRGHIISGAVLGAAGRDWLDYSNYHYHPPSLAPIPINVTVNLGMGRASATGSVGGIEHVVGGLGSDTITGNGSDNILVGGEGNDLLRGNGRRDLLIGGNGSDTIAGGAGEDLLIAGTTTYDLEGPNLSALTAILTEWGRTNANSNYSQRIANLRNGVGANSSVRLVFGTTVFDDMYVDRLTGGTEADWFWEQNRFYVPSPLLPPPPPRDTLTDWESSLLWSEVIN